MSRQRKWRIHGVYSGTDLGLGLDESTQLIELGVRREKRNRRACYKGIDTRESEGERLCV